MLRREGKVLASQLGDEWGKQHRPDSTWRALGLEVQPGEQKSRRMHAHKHEAATLPLGSPPSTSERR